MPPPPVRQTHELSGSRRVRVLWDYQAQQEDELSLARGEVVEVMTADGDWWIGAIGDCVGAFPSNYVCPLEQAPLAAGGILAAAAAAVDGASRPCA